MDITHLNFYIVRLQHAAFPHVLPAVNVRIVSRASIPRPIRLEAFLKAWSFPVHSKSVLSLVFNDCKESTSAKPVLETPSGSGSKFRRSLKLQKTLRI